MTGEVHPASLIEVHCKKLETELADLRRQLDEANVEIERLRALIDTLFGYAEANIADMADMASQFGDAADEERLERLAQDARAAAQAAAEEGQ